MRKGKYLLIIFMMLLIVPLNIFAKGGVTVSTTSFTLTKGGSKAVTIKADNCAGKITISSSNPSVATVSTGSMFLDMQSSTLTITSKSVGTAVITVYLADVTTYDDIDLTGKTYKINVTVKNVVVDNRSKNNNLKEISVEGYKLTKIDDHNYELTVENNIENITLNATAEDTKAVVSGTGEKKIAVGPNAFEIIITSESGAKNQIAVKVIRKDGYYLEDLEKIIDNASNSEIILKNTDKVSVEELNLIKKKGKKVNLNYLDSNNILQYSWLIDGSKIGDAKAFDSSISFASNNKKEIDEASNYARGFNIDFAHSGDLPSGTSVKLYVGDKFENGSLVNIYQYNKTSKMLDLVKNSVMVQDSYINLSFEHCSSYFVTMSSIKEKVNANTNTNIFKIISIVELLIILCLFGVGFAKRKKCNSEIKIDKPIEEIEKI